MFSKLAEVLEDRLRGNASSFAVNVVVNVDVDLGEQLSKM